MFAAAPFAVFGYVVCPKPCANPSYSFEPMVGRVIFCTRTRILLAIVALYHVVTSPLSPAKPSVLLGFTYFVLVSEPLSEQKNWFFPTLPDTLNPLKSFFVISAHESNGVNVPLLITTGLELNES